MKKLFLLAGAALLAAPLASCGSGTVRPQAGDTIFIAPTAGEQTYGARPYFDVSDPAERLCFEIDVAGDISQIIVGREQLYPGEDFGYADGVLTIKTDSFLDEEGNSLLGTGDISFSIVGDEMASIDVLFVNKVLRTVDDVLALNDYEDEDNPTPITGSYILGNDIDFSSISNMQPIGYSNSDDGLHNNDFFNGVFDGNGYTISGVNIVWNTDLSSNKNIYDGQPLWSDVSHSEGVNYGFFQEIGAAGVVRNVRFEDCSIKGKSIVGVVAGLVSGRIENVVVDSSCDVTASTHYYDESCNAAGLAGILGTTGSVENCVVLTDDISVLEQYTDYDDVYLDEIPVDGTDPINYHVFYGGTKGWNDSNGADSTGVYGGVGLTYGNCRNCVSLRGGESHYWTQTHLEANKPADGEDVGTAANCLSADEATIKSASTYASFPLDSWVIADGAYPRLRASHPYRIAE